MRLALRWLIPGGFLFGLTLGAIRLDQLDRISVDDLATAYALLVYGAALGLAVAFHRSRVLVVVALVAATDWAHRRPASPAEDDVALLVLLAPVLVLLLGIGAVLRDRGITSPWGALQLLAASAVGAALVPIVRNPTIPEALPQTIPGADVLHGLVGIHPVLLPFATAGFVLSSFAAYRWRGPVERALVWSQVMVVASAHPSLTPSHGSLFLMAAGLTLGLAVLETSYAMAYRDELTGLPARRSLMRDLDGLTGTYTLAMVDVDHFKQFNDRHGHDVGDQVLRLVASRLEGVPGGGRAYRYGGEEFTILFRGKARDEAIPHVEAVRRQVEAARFTLRRWNRPRKKPEQTRRRSDRGRGKATATAKRGGAPAAKSRRGARKLSVTVSVGVADDRGSATTPEEVLKNADRALYRAKRDGRNRVST